MNAKKTKKTPKTRSLTPAQIRARRERLEARKLKFEIKVVQAEASIVELRARCPHRTTTQYHENDAEFRKYKRCVDCGKQLPVSG